MTSEWISSLLKSPTLIRLPEAEKNISTLAAINRLLPSEMLPPLSPSLSLKYFSFYVCIGEGECFLAFFCSVGDEEKFEAKSQIVQLFILSISQPASPLFLTGCPTVS